MAENESLDLRKCPRWQPVLLAVVKGASPEDISRKASKALIGSLRAALKQMAKRGVSFEELLTAAENNDSRKLHDLVRKCKGHDYCRLFSESAAFFENREDLVKEYIRCIFDKCLDQIELKAARRDRWKGFGDLRCCLDEVRDQVEPEVDRVAKKLSEDTRWLPKREPGRPGLGAQDNTHELMGISLLGVR
jgi:hypothetical protein